MTAATERESQKRASRHDCVLRFLPLCDVPAEPGAYIDRKAARPTGAPGAPAETGACTGEKAERLAAGAPANPAERPGTPACSAPLLFSLCDVPAEPGAYIDRKAARPTGAPAGPAGRRCTGRVLRPTSRSAPAEPGARTGEKAEKLAPGTPASPAGPAFPVGSDGRPRESRHKDAGSGSKAMSVSASMIIDYWRHAPEPHRLLFCGDCATTVGIFPPFLSSGTLDGGLMSRPADASTMLVTSLVPIIAFAVDEASFYAVAPCSSDPTSPGYIDYSEVRDSVPRELFNEAVLRFGESAAVLLATFGATCLEVTEFYGYKYGTIPVGLPRGFPIYYDDIPCRDWAALEPWEKVTALGALTQLYAWSPESVPKYSKTAVADAHGWLRPLLVTFIEKSKALSRDHRKILRNDIVAAFGLAPGPARVSPKREWPASLPGGLTVGTVPFGKFSFADFSRACGFHPAHWDASAVLRDWDQPAHKAVSLYFPHILKAAEAARKRRGAAASGDADAATAATASAPPADPKSRARAPKVAHGAAAAPRHPSGPEARRGSPAHRPRSSAPPAPAKPAAAAGNTDTADADADDDVDRPRASRSTRPPKRTKATEASAPKAPRRPQTQPTKAASQTPRLHPPRRRKHRPRHPNPPRAARPRPPTATRPCSARGVHAASRPRQHGRRRPASPVLARGSSVPFLQHQQQPRYSAASTVTPAGWVVQAPPHFAAPWPSPGTANHGAGMFPGFGGPQTDWPLPTPPRHSPPAPVGSRRPLRQPRGHPGRAEARPARRRSADRAAPDLILHPRPTVRPSDAEMEDEAESDAPGDEPAGEDDWAGDWDSDDTSTPQDASPHVDAPSESESAAPVYSGKATRGHAKEKAPLEAPAPKKARGDDKAKGATAQAKATAAEKAAPPAEPPSQQRPFPDERITTALAKYGIACMRDLARFSHGLVLRDMGNSELRQAIAAFDQKLRDIAQTSAVLQACLEDDPLFKRLLKRLQDSASQAAHSYGGVATFSYDDDGDVEDPGSGGPTHRGQQRGRAWKQARRQYGTAQPAQPQPHHRYYHIALNKDTQRLLAFRWRGKLYIYQALCFGVNIACFAFTKVTRAFAKYWAALGVKLCTYIDDGLFICPSREIAELVSQHLRACAPELGITFSEKSDFTPTQCTEYLGIEIDVRPDRGVFAVTPKKVAKTLARLAGVLDRAPGPRGLTASARDLQKLAGSLIALRMAFPALAVTIEGPALDCLRWLQAALQRPERPAHPIWTPRTFFRLFTDASGYGYAAFLDQLESADPTAVRQRPAWSVFGTFPPNSARARAPCGAARPAATNASFARSWPPRTSSSRPSVARGGGSARLFDLSARLWHRCAALGVSISARHLPGAANVFADRGSRDGARAPSLHRALLSRCRTHLDAPLAEHHHVAFEDDPWLGSVRASAPTVLTRPALWASCSLPAQHHLVVTPAPAEAELAAWQGAAFAPGTSAGQRRAARRYFEFVECHGLAPDAERSILLFLADAATQRRRHSGKDLAASTVKGLAAHVWRELKLRGLVDPTRPRSFMYSTAWRGMQARLGRPVAQRRAFLPGDLRAWLTTPSFLSRALPGASATPPSSRPASRASSGERSWWRCGTAHGAVVYLTPGKCPASCPVRLLCAYVASTAVQAAPGTPLFPRLSDPAAAITVGFVRRLVKEAAEAIGYDPTDFSGHSLRRGGATAAARRGLPATWIRRHGRWALYSSVPQGYIEDYLFHLSSDLADLGF
eukprot:tig00021326_g20317.t2